MEETWLKGITRLLSTRGTLVFAACFSAILIGLDSARSAGEPGGSFTHLVDPGQAPAARRTTLEALATADGAAFGSRVVAVWPELPPAARAAALERILADEGMSLAFLSAARESDLRSSDIDTRALYLLRTHESESVRNAAARTTAMLTARRLTERPAAGDLSEHLLPGTGNVARGAEVFETHCSLCHEFAGRGKDLGPHLGGFELFGREALLTEIIDPNREVAGDYAAYTVVLKTGETLTGMIAAEDETTLLLRQNGRSDVIDRAAILALRSTGASLMPEGLEKTLQHHEIDDLIAYLTKDAPAHAQRYRALSLRVAANADGSQGLYTSIASVREALPLKSYGCVEVADIPFTLLHPAATEGHNMIVLRGGPKDSLAGTYPLRAELEGVDNARRLHILGAVGGWGFPTTPEEVPVVTVKLHYRDGPPEIHVWRNGVEVADSHGRRNVPGSQPGLRIGRRQVRLVSIDLTRPGLERLTFESAGGPVAPAFLAVTAELSD